MITDSWGLITGLKKYLDVVPRIDELPIEERKRFVNDFKRDYSVLIEFLESQIK